MTSGLVGRVVVVTGSAQSIGRAVCVAAAEAGMKVVGIDVNVDGGEETARLCTTSVASAWFYRCDVSDPKALGIVFDQIEHDVGPTSVLVNNAGLVIHSAPEDISFADWQRVIGVSLTGQAFAAQLAGRSMISAGNGGSIVNLTSIAGIAALGRGNFSHSVAKAGIIGMTRELAIEWANYGIRVNAVAPSQVNTEGFRALVGDHDVADGSILRAAVSGIPLGRLAEISDIVSAIMFLMSEEGSFITGIVLPVDGGSLAMHAGATLRGRESA